MLAITDPSELDTWHNWDKIFIDIGASWTHSGDPHTQPFIRTSSGLLSAGCFRGRKVQEDPELLSKAAASLIAHPGIRQYLKRRIHKECPIDRVLGSATSGIALASHIALQIGAKTAFAEKDSESPCGFSFKGFTFEPNELVLIVDDTVTTGRTLQGVRDALLLEAPSAKIIPAMLVLCNRSNCTEIAGHKILSLITRSIERWPEGENPYTKDGKEILPPVEPKSCK
jgi:adenine/guanine phosphoribosyltransferase-like PRPP-binding protein